LTNPDHTLELSSISLVEIAIKTGLGKLRFSAEAIRQAIRDLDLRVLAFTADHAMQLFALPRHHSDPFDRQIISQALNEGLPVITPDESFERYQGLKVIW
jgi:PIN domain nuclease of toxin-antitoxin system